jgi:6-phosphogluconolactonase
MNGGSTMETYSLEREPVPPSLPGTVVMRPEIDDLFAALAADLMIHAHNCVREFGAFHLALSGGSTPMPFYLRLLTDPNYRQMPWHATHVWVVDERRVPADDDRSNYKHIHEFFVHSTDIPPEQAHDPMALRDDADVAYERAMRDALATREPGQQRLDFVLLGMGEDGHTASLFPHSPALRAAGDRLVVFNDGPSVTPPPRLTMTYRAINSARFVAVLVTGEKKRAMLAEVASGRSAAERVPIMGVHPAMGEQRWYIDGAACPAGA